MHDFLNDKRFEGIKKLEKRAHLSSATPHAEEELFYIKDCYKTNWITTLGLNIDAIEQDLSAYMSSNGHQKYIVALTNGTAAMQGAKRAGNPYECILSQTHAQAGGF